MHIISGYKKNKKIITPKRDFRPTQSKVRETLFNIIEVKDKIFLDLCSGSGAIGFEALSREAKYCIFIEIDREAIKNIFTNAKNIFEDESEKYKIKRKKVALIQISFDMIANFSVQCKHICKICHI